MTHAFGQFEMRPGTHRSVYSSAIVDVLQQNGKLGRGTVDPVHAIPQTEEEAGLAVLNPQIGSVTLGRPREPVVGAFQALVRDTFRRHDIPKDGGMDIGSGATGYMVARLLPPEAKANWLQMELNPQAAQMNRDANPGQHVITGSYLRLQEQGVKNMLNVVSGLSSLDATGHIDKAVEEIRQAVKVGGYLLHVQDTRPGMIYPHQELEHMQAATPYHVVYVTDPNAQPNNAILYRNGIEAYDVIELFRRRLGRALADNGNFEIVENTWMTAVGSGTKRGMNQHSELGIYVGLQAERDTIDAASAAITVARRVR